MNNIAPRICLYAIVVLLISSCSSLFGPEGRRGVSSSLVDYLYPYGEIPPDHQNITPHLHLPLTVGLAFVPPHKSRHSVLPEAQKIRLLESVKQRFVDLDYVKEIKIIPETYMRSSKGFEGVGQIARLYGLDVMALVSYDQVATRSEKKSSLLYWTIAGAYLIKGNQNRATTFVDTAVFDVNSQKMLFRAPGVSETSQSSTLIETREVNRATREKGFELAMADMSNNLEAELIRFKNKVKNDDSVRVTRRTGYGGGGGIGWPSILLLLGLAIARLRGSH